MYTSFDYGQTFCKKPAAMIFVLAVCFNILIQKSRSNLVVAAYIINFIYDRNTFVVKILYEPHLQSKNWQVRRNYTLMLN
jgi:hypothetical protein